MTALIIYDLLFGKWRVGVLVAFGITLGLWKEGDRTGVDVTRKRNILGYTLFL
jgi:hypothetical protein